MLQIYGKQLTNNRGKSVGVYTRVGDSCSTLIASKDRSVVVPFDIVAREELQKGIENDCVSEHVENINRALIAEMDCSEQIDLNEYTNAVITKLIKELDEDRVDWMKRKLNGN